MFNRQSLLVLVSLSVCFVFADRVYTITNNCPITAPLYINGVHEQDLAVGASTTRTVAEGWSGFIYTIANQGNEDGHGTVRAGFYGTDDYYYLVKDPSWINVGVSVMPVNRAPKGGFCLQQTCEYPACLTNDYAAFDQPPTRFPPSHAGIPPNMPLVQCPADNTGYTVTFCPSGTIPNLQTGPNLITPVNHSNKCLQVAGASPSVGAQVQISDCNGSQNQKWTIKRGKGPAKISGTNLCLDAGSSAPTNGAGLTVTTCITDLPSQTWFYDGVSKNIWLYNNGQCLDVPNGIVANGTPAQLWQCTYDDADQLWNI